MGLAQLEWHQQSEQRPRYTAWVARVETPSTVNPDVKRYRRYAHINMLPWHVEHKKGKHVVDLLDAFKAAEQYYWFDSIEDAKLFVEAIFALDND